MLGENIRRYRTEKKLTQEELGRLIDLQASTLSLFESGRRVPSAYVLGDIAVALQVSADRLLGIQIGDVECASSKSELLDIINRLPTIAEESKEYLIATYSMLEASHPAKKPRKEPEKKAAPNKRKK